jgi:FkbM family methyltransferase
VERAADDHGPGRQVRARELAEAECASAPRPAAMATSPANQLGADPVFRGTPLYHYFRQHPLGFIDVGARGGAHPLVEPAAELIQVLGFEPDLAALALLQEESRNAPFARSEYSPFALAEKKGPHPLHLCAAETNHSLRAPNEVFCARYQMAKFAKVGETTVNCRTLDDLLLPRLEQDPYLAEFLKIDTQGTEHEILEGAQEVLRRGTVALFVEVSFSPIYAGQSRFSELELFLRSLGFAFFGFDRLHYRSRKKLDKHREAGRERLLYSDAVFFKDPLARAEIGSWTPRQNKALFLSSLLLGYYDFCLELLPLIAESEDERASLRLTIQGLARRDPAEAAEALATLHEQVKLAPDRANVLAGKFVDARRHWPDYDEIVLRKPEPVYQSRPLPFSSSQEISQLDALRETEFFRQLKAEPLGFIDIGARGGVHGVVDPLAEMVAVLAFEPDPEECERMRPELAKTAFARVDLRACGIAGKDGNFNLHLLANSVNHSLLSPNQHLVGRYKIRGFEEKGVLPVPCRSLDGLLLGDMAEEKFRGEFIKIDTQGAEYDILNGAQEVLRTRTMALVVESCFFELYENQKCFSELELWLRQRGFVLYGFHDLHYRSQKHLDKKKEQGRERLFFTDAVFFRDPLDEINAGAAFAPRQWTSLFASALLLRYYDFALELLEQPVFAEPERKRLSALVHQLASLPPARTAEEVARVDGLAKAHPKWAQVLAGKFIDQRRAYPDYDEIIEK